LIWSAAALLPVNSGQQCICAESGLRILLAVAERCRQKNSAAGFSFQNIVVIIWSIGRFWEYNRRTNYQVFFKANIVGLLDGLLETMSADALRRNLLKTSKGSSLARICWGISHSLSRKKSTTGGNASISTQQQFHNAKRLFNNVVEEVLVRGSSGEFMIGTTSNDGSNSLNALIARQNSLECLGENYLASWPEEVNLVIEAMENFNRNADELKAMMSRGTNINYLKPTVVTPTSSVATTTATAASRYSEVVAGLASSGSISKNDNVDDNVDDDTSSGEWQCTPVTRGNSNLQTALHFKNGSGANNNRLQQQQPRMGRLSRSVSGSSSGGSGGGNASVSNKFDVLADDCGIDSNAGDDTNKSNKKRNSRK